MSLEFRNPWHFSHLCPPLTFNLLQDYGKVTDDQVEVVCTAQMGAADF